MKSKVNIEVGDICILSTSKLIRTGNTTTVSTDKTECEILDLERAEAVILLNGLKTRCEIKNLEIKLKYTDREFSSMVLTRNSIMGYGNIHKGKKMKDVPSYYLKHLIDYEYEIPNNLNIYIAEHWNRILMESNPDSVFDLKKYNNDED